MCVFLSQDRLESRKLDVYNFKVLFCTPTYLNFNSFSASAYKLFMKFDVVRLKFVSYLC